MSLTYLLAGFSVTRWLWSAWGELCSYTLHMSTTQWGILAASTIAFGFMCLRGYDIKT
ncbi:hypothetical protein [Crateriforma conspicua]|uniref:hypothetical protein n=1 Tax=Crateriforma conspicua TaxID=2527996 RepID=UPI00118824DD|nr:hypothetical protein [Crateriforma conspicua]QDV61040.1 hypothetical protein Mal65_01620 [Crateriforma conspicua]